jgi:hypothetical protein
MKRRYLLKGAGLSLKFRGEKNGGAEIWLGLEVESNVPLDLERISKHTGWHLVPADGMSDDEISSCGVTEWQPIRLS